MENFIKKMHSHLFDSRADIPAVFNELEQDMVIRYRAAFTKWLEEPHLTDTAIINYLVNEYGIKKSQAYKDIFGIKSLIGNVNNAGKEFQRYRATDMILKGFQIAEKAKNQTEVKRAMALIKAGEALVKVHQLNKEELNEIKWDEVIPISLEPTTDVTVIGQKPIKNLDQLKNKLRKKYGSSVN